MSGENSLILPDTNIFIYAIKGDEPFAAKLISWDGAERLLLSVIVIGEFLSGGSKKERINFQKLTTGDLPIIDINLKITEQAAGYRRKFHKKGYRLKLPDALISASAKVSGAVLATNNPSHYPMDDIEKLVLE